MRLRRIDHREARERLSLLRLTHVHFAAEDEGGKKIAAHVVIAYEVSAS